MALVLAFGVQGIAKALTLDPSTSPVNHSTVTVNSKITLNSISGSLNNSSQTESVQVGITGSGTANFTDPDDDTTTATTHTWTEQTTTTTTDLTAGNGAIKTPSSLEITARAAGTVAVKVSWTSKDKTSNDDDRDVSETFTFYIVPDSSPKTSILAFDALKC